MRWFTKKTDDYVSIKAVSQLSFEISELFRNIKQLETKITAIEIDMRFLQDKFKNRIYKDIQKAEQSEKDETNKKPNMFLNPYGNPI